MSKTAKSGFDTEDQVVREFNNWKNSKYASSWMSCMGYDTVQSISAVTTRSMGGNSKADVIVTIDGFDVGISIKKFTASFNQIDKRRVDNYAKMWDMPDDITDTLRKYCGVCGFRPVDDNVITRDSRRYFLDELTPKERDGLVGFFAINKDKIMYDVLHGTNADYILVIRKDDEKITESGLVRTEKAIQHYGGNVSITKRGNLKLGKITVQRKGGNGGGITAQMLQFKFSPKDILNL